MTYSLSDVCSFDEGAVDRLMVSGEGFGMGGSDSGNQGVPRSIIQSDLSTSSSSKAKQMGQFGSARQNVGISGLNPLNSDVHPAGSQFNGGISSGPSSWVDLLCSPKSEELVYTPPMVVRDKVVVEPPDDVLEEGWGTWENSPVG